MKDFTVFEDGDKTSPTKRLETVYLPRKPLAEDIQASPKKVSSAKSSAAEKKSGADDVLSKVQSCFDQFNATMNANKGVIDIKHSSIYVFSVRAIMPHFRSLPSKIDEVCVNECAVQSSRLLAKAYKLAGVPFANLIDHFCKDTEKSRVSLPSKEEWDKIALATSPFDFLASTNRTSTYPHGSIFIYFDGKNTHIAAYYYRYQHFFLPIIRESLDKRNYKFDAFCWLGRNGLLLYKDLENMDWDNLSSDDDITVKLGKAQKQAKSATKAADSVSEISEEEAQAWFCCSDARRSADDPHVSSILTDHNKGHWDLSDNAQDGSRIAVKLETPVYARNPWVDIKWDSTIGIDFGTTSTVVSKLGDTGNITIVAVGGSGDAAGDEVNENPTILELIDFEKFWKAYNSNKGRPETSWQDLSVSWIAKRDLDESNAVNFYSFINTLKQWAAAKDLWLYPKAAKNENNDIKIKPFTKLGDEEFNPVEVYAYYIGMAINNMRDQSIYPHYLLSFPVNYSNEIVDKIVSSFKRGLLRSLPGSLVRDKEFRRQFSVEKYASEPAAYAVCALEVYGFSPKDENDKQYYGIFDFGGGTTDFDYGVWRGANEEEKESGYSFVIEHFNASGDQFLGGENILANMAFKVYAREENQKELRRKEVKFTHTFDTKDDLPWTRGNIDDTSQWARLNMYKMQEALRSIWHQEAGYKENFKDGKLHVTLFNNVGDQVTDCALTVSVGDLESYIEERIRKGVKHFFEGMEQEIGKHEDIDAMNIFLAGNSCKSPVVKRIFDEECKAYCSTHRKEEDFFDIYPPLGSAECFTKLDRKKIAHKKNDPYFPTGKTGVAIGLIMTRPGHDVLVKGAREEGRQIGFQFTVGREERRAFTPVIKLNTPVVYDAADNNEGWVPFGKKALTSSFEILYSPVPSAVLGKIELSECKRKKVSLPDACPDASIGVRPFSPDSIEVGLFLNDDAEPVHKQEISFK